MAKIGMSGIFAWWVRTGDSGIVQIFALHNNASHALKDIRQPQIMVQNMDAFRKQKDPKPL
jgi:hypothetical protein